MWRHQPHVSAARLALRLPPRNGSPLIASLHSLPPHLSSGFTSGPLTLPFPRAPITLLAAGLQRHADMVNPTAKRMTEVGLLSCVQHRALLAFLRRQSVPLGSSQLSSWGDDRRKPDNLRDRCCFHYVKVTCQHVMGYMTTSLLFAMVRYPDYIVGDRRFSRNACPLSPGWLAAPLFDPGGHQRVAERLSIIELVCLPSHSVIGTAPSYLAEQATS